MSVTDKLGKYVDTIRFREFIVNLVKPRILYFQHKFADDLSTSQNINNIRTFNEYIGNFEVTISKYGKKQLLIDLNTMMKIH